MLKDTPISRKGWKCIVFSDPARIGPVEDHLATVTSQTLEYQRGARSLADFVGPKRSRPDATLGPRCVPAPSGWSQAKRS